MPGIVPKNISSRQSGQISSGTQRIGNTKSSGSATRMVSHCKSTGSSTDCVNQVFNIILPKIIKRDNLNNLFDIESFSNQQLNITTLYKIMLTDAANRWSKYLFLDIDAIEVIRNYKNDKNWKGIYLENYTEIYGNPNDIYPITVETNPIFSGAALFYKFSLTINVNSIFIPKTEYEGMLDMFTNCLGRALGFIDNNNIRPILISASPSKEVTHLSKLLAGISGYYIPIEFQRKPASGFLKSTTSPSIYSFPNLNKAYQDYGGTRDGRNEDIITNEAITDGVPLNWGLQEFEIPLGFSSIQAFSNVIFESPPEDYGRSKYLKRGVENEVMSQTYFGGSNNRAYISLLSIGFFTDLFTIVNGSKIYSYVKKGNSEVNSFKSTNGNIRFNK
jgi:hypothetical protein